MLQRAGNCQWDHSTLWHNCSSCQVSCSRNSPWFYEIYFWCWYVVLWLHSGWTLSRVNHAINLNEIKFSDISREGSLFSPERQPWINSTALYRWGTDIFCCALVRCLFPFLYVVNRKANGGGFACNSISLRWIYARVIAMHKFKYNTWGTRILTPVLYNFFLNTSYVFWP